MSSVIDYKDGKITTTILSLNIVFGVDVCIRFLSTLNIRDHSCCIVEVNVTREEWIIYIFIQHQYTVLTNTHKKDIVQEVTNN